MHRRHERERQIDPRRHARRRPHVPVRNPARDGLPLHRAELADERRPVHLVRRRLAPVEHARSAEERRARAHGDDRVQARVHGLDELNDLAQRELRAGAHPARHEEDVELRRRGEGVCGHDGLREALLRGVERGGDRVERGGDDGERDGLGPCERVEDVERTKGVERLKAWEEDYPILCGGI